MSRLDRHLSAAAGHAADADEPPDGSWAAALPLLAAAAQRRRPELAVLRLGDGSLLPAGARNTTCLAAWSGPASSACAVLPLLSVQLIDVLTTGEKVCRAELPPQTTGGISPPQLRLTMLSNCLHPGAP